MQRTITEKIILGLGLLAAVSVAALTLRPACRPAGAADYYPGSGLYYASATDACFDLQLRGVLALGACVIGERAMGGSTTQFDISKPYLTNQNVVRYTYDGTGTNPGLSATRPGTRSAIIRFNAQNFSAGNNGYFEVATSATNYVEVTNAAGVAESNKTIGAGSVGYRNSW